MNLFTEPCNGQCVTKPFEWIMEYPWFMQGSHASWKVLDFFLENSKTWKVLEKRPLKSRIFS